MAEEHSQVSYDCLYWGQNSIIQGMYRIYRFVLESFGTDPTTSQPLSSMQSAALKVNELALLTWRRKRCSHCYALMLSVMVLSFYYLI